MRLKLLAGVNILMASRCLPGFLPIWYSQLSPGLRRINLASKLLGMQFCELDGYVDVVCHFQQTERQPGSTVQKTSTQ